MFTALFVYGTLMPGGSRWPALRPWCLVEEGRVAQVAGVLFGTGRGWPAAVFDATAATVVPGVLLDLRPGSVAQALAVLDDVEGVDEGLFERRTVQVDGQSAWAYHWPSSTCGFRRIDRWDHSLEQSR